MTVPRHGVLLVVLGVGLAGCDSGAGPSSTTRTPLTPDALLVTPAEVGPGIILQQITGGHTVTGVVTLDLCKAMYTSEAMRTARAQVNYVDPSINRVAASQEVVQYATGGTGRAYTELKAAIARCPASYQVGGGSPTTISHVTLEAAYPRLLPSQLTVSQMVSFADGTSAWSVSLYQFDGNDMSAIYTGRPQKDQALNEALVLGRVAAARMVAPAPERTRKVSAGASGLSDPGS